MDLDGAWYWRGRDDRYTTDSDGRTFGALVTQKILGGPSCVVTADPLIIINGRYLMPDPPPAHFRWEPEDGGGMLIVGTDGLVKYRMLGKHREFSEAAEQDQYAFERVEPAP